ncbi:hypothetical protein DFS33DRAFT_1407495 [Desarmillaria ectypa]|nr:hypothetical protein DFS33DRAFT_1407495 [Desarmillaria ectypa]
MSPEVIDGIAAEQYFAPLPGVLCEPLKTSTLSSTAEWARNRVSATLIGANNPTRCRSGRKEVYLDDDSDEPLGPDLPEEELIPRRIEKKFSMFPGLYPKGVNQRETLSSSPSSPDLSTARIHSEHLNCTITTTSFGFLTRVTPLAESFRNAKFDIMAYRNGRLTEVLQSVMHTGCPIVYSPEPQDITVLPRPETGHTLQYNDTKLETTRYLENP